MVIINRALAGHSREGGGKSSFRIDITGQNTRHGISHLDAQMPGLYDGRYKTVFPFQSKRTAVHQPQDHRFSGVHQHLDQFLLTSRQCNIRTGGSFPGHGVQFSQHCYDHISVIPGFEDIIPVNISLRSSAGEVTDIFKGGLHALKDRDAILLLPAHSPGADDLFFIVSQISDQRDFRIFL